MRHLGCVPTRRRRCTEGSTCGPHCRNVAWGEKCDGGGGAVLIADGISSGPCQPVLAQTRLGVESEQC
jgi:hypothetical protein